MYETTPMCERCGDPFIPTQPGQKYCSGRCREAAKKRRSRLRPLAGKLLGRIGDTGDMSLSELHERATPAGFVTADDDFVLPGGDDDLDDEVELDDADEHDADVHEFLGQAGTSHRRMFCEYWNSAGRRTGVQPAEQVADRTERRRASIESNINRLKNAPGQVESRFNESTRGVVAEAGRASRKLNSYRRASDMPPPDMQGPVFDARMMPPAINRGDHGSRSAAWRMSDGFRW
jgi:hypothetical protein